MRLLTCGLLAYCLCEVAFAQPSIGVGGVVNAASFSQQGLPNSAIAQGSIFSVFGANMGTSAAAGVTATAFPLTANLDDGTGKTTSVAVTVGGTTTNALMIFARHDQINAVLPSNTPVGTGTITVTYNGQTSATQPITVVKTSMGVFTVNQGGSGPGVVTDANFKLITRTNSAKPGQTLILWGTGAGPVTFDESRPPTTSVNLQSTAKAQIYVNGTLVTPSYVGRSGCCSGEDQINFQVPQGVSGCNISVAVQTGDPVVSNFASIAVAPGGGTCSDSNGLTSTDLAKLQSQGSLKIGVLGMGRITTTTPSIAGQPASTTTSDDAFGSFVKYDLTTFNKNQGLFRSASIGGCVVFTFSGQNTQTTDPVKPVPLDAGSPISLTGPGFSGSLTRFPQFPGFYSATVTGDPFATGGAYTFAGPGGADVGIFNAHLNVSPALTWTNAAQVTTVRESAGQLITWTGGDPSGTVEISGSSISGIQAPIVGASFVCITPNSAKQFTIPSAVLLTLPPSPSDSLIPFGSLSVSAQGALQSFTAPGLDIGFAIASDGSGQSVNYVQQ
jgi:uncharacterized protein (TIGR03437 family)